MATENALVELHVFTNSTSVIETHQPIFKTIDSFCKTFGDTSIHIWCDKNPNIDASREYIKKLVRHYGPANITITNSLSDGYIQAITQSKSDFLFMLEHDWIFNSENILHSLPDICKVMLCDDLHHLRFNKYHNANSINPIESNYVDFQKAKDQFFSSTVPYYTVSSASNNPHIVHKQLYQRDLLSKIKVETESNGIEHNLRNIIDAKFAVYGNLSTGPCVEHLDGRNENNY